MITTYLSPNFNDRPDGMRIQHLVLHYTGMKSFEDARDRLCDPAAQVSSHYIIDETSEIYQLVPDEKRAWHAGISHWRGQDNINDSSIGIEIVNPGHEFGYRPFPASQIKSVISLSQSLIHTHKIPAVNIVGHSDIAPGRKQDPGELFPWKLLAQEKIGLFPQLTTQENSIDKPAAFKMLSAIGYQNECDKSTCTAFQSRFCPTELSRGMTLKTYQTIKAVAELFNK